MKRPYKIRSVLIMSALLLALTSGCTGKPQALSGTLGQSETQATEDDAPRPMERIRHFDGYSGSVDSAITDYTNAIDRDDPEGFYHAQRAVAWHAKGEYAKADEDFRMALKILTNESTRHLDYAWFLATCPGDEFRDGKRAVEHVIRFFEVATDQTYYHTRKPRKWNQAIRLAVAKDRLGGGMSLLFVKGWNWESLETFAASFAESGEFDRAVKWQQLALDSFVHDGTPIGHLTENDIRQMNERLELYKQEKPLRISARTKR